MTLFKPPVELHQTFRTLHWQSYNAMARRWDLEFAYNDDKYSTLIKFNATELQHFLHKIKIKIAMFNQT